MTRVPPHLRSQWRWIRFTRCLPLAALVFVALTTATGMAARDGVFPGGGPLPLAEFVRAVQDLEGRDFYLNLECGCRSEFPALPLRLDGAPLPQNKRQMTQLLARLRLPHYIEGDAIVIQDPGLATLAGRNPLEVTAPGVARDKVGLMAIISSFGVSVHMGIAPSGELNRVERLTMESGAPLSLRAALNRVSHEHQVEWIARVLPADDMPADYATSRYTTTPDGKTAIRIYYPKGAVFMSARERTGGKRGTGKEREDQPAPTREIATVDDLIKAILNTKERGYFFCAETAETGFPPGKLIASPGPGIPVSATEVCRLLDSLSLRYVRFDNVIVLQNSVPLAPDEANPMELKRSGVIVNSGPVGLLIAFGVNSRLDAPPAVSPAVLLKTPAMRVSSAGEASLRELLALMARDKNCEWIAYVRPRGAAAPGSEEPAEPGLVRLTFSERP